MGQNRFDLEQEIMSCWGITDDLNDLYEAVMEHPTLNRDHVANIVLGLAELYELKFDKMFTTFTKCIHNAQVD